jgi:hypothetical protein
VPVLHRFELDQMTVRIAQESMNDTLLPAYWTKDQLILVHGAYRKQHFCVKQCKDEPRRRDVVWLRSSATRWQIFAWRRAIA